MGYYIVFWKINKQQTKSTPQKLNKTKQKGHLPTPQKNPKQTNKKAKPNQIPNISDNIAACLTAFGKILYGIYFYW